MTQLRKTLRVTRNWGNQSESSRSGVTMYVSKFRHRGPGVYKDKLACPLLLFPLPNLFCTSYKASATSKSRILWSPHCSFSLNTIAGIFLLVYVWVLLLYSPCCHPILQSPDIRMYYFNWCFTRSLSYSYSQGQVRHIHHYQPFINFVATPNYTLLCGRAHCFELFSQSHSFPVRVVSLLVFVGGTPEEG